MDIFVAAAIAVLALMAGFWAGRALRWQGAEDEEEMPAEVGLEAILAEKREKNLNPNQRRITLGQVIGSPASGNLTVSEENGIRTVHIAPEQGKIYAPASGRITRLYPMGSAMQFHTEFGAELLIEIGQNADEMCSDCYRCRVMEHEVVRKGKLLLECDVKGLHENGVGTEITMRVANEEPGSVAVTSDKHVSAGEEIMWVKNHSTSRTGN